VVATMPRTGARASATARRKAAGRTVTYALALVGSVVSCASIHMCGCMRLDAVSAERSTALRSLSRTQGQNARIAERLHLLVSPDRLTKIAEGKGMTPVTPSSIVSCPPPARMAKAADTLSLDSPEWR